MAMTSNWTPADIFRTRMSDNAYPIELLVLAPCGGAVLRATHYRLG